MSGEGTTTWWVVWQGLLNLSLLNDHEKMNSFTVPANYCQTRYWNGRNVNTDIAVKSNAYYPKLTWFDSNRSSSEYVQKNSKAQNPSCPKNYLDIHTNLWISLQSNWHGSDTNRVKLTKWMYKVSSGFTFCLEQSLLLKFTM